MNDWAEPAVTRDDLALAAPFIAEMLRQMRAVDHYGVWEGAGDHEVLDPFVMTKQRKREIPVIGDPDEETIARVNAWYNALSAMIEARTGRMAVPFISLHYEGFGRALIAVGRLIVLDRTLRDIHRFGFKSLEAMADEAERIVAAAVRLIDDHPDVADLQETQMPDPITGLTLRGSTWVPQFVVKLDDRKCIGCGRCYKVCPRDVLSLVERADLGMTDDDDPFGDDDEDEDLDDDNAMVMSLKNRGDCIGCEACARICPKRCFTLAAAPIAADLA